MRKKQETSIAWLGSWKGFWRAITLLIDQRQFREYQENHNIKKSSSDELKSSGLPSAAHKFLFLYCVVFLRIEDSPLSPFSYFPHHSVRQHRSIRKHFRLHVVLFADQIIFFDCHFLVFLRSSSCSKYQLRKVIKISAGWFFYRHEIRKTGKRSGRKNVFRDCDFISHWSNFEVLLKLGTFRKLRWLGFHQQMLFKFSLWTAYTLIYGLLLSPSDTQRKYSSERNDVSWSSFFYPEERKDNLWKIQYFHEMNNNEATALLPIPPPTCSIIKRISKEFYHPLQKKNVYGEYLWNVKYKRRPFSYYNHEWNVFSRRYSRYKQ